MIPFPDQEAKPQLLIEQDYLRDLIDGCRGEKHFYNAQGEQVFSPRDANFVLRPQQKLVIHEGQMLLLNQSDDIHQMGAESRANAADNFKKQQNNIIHIPKMVKDNVDLDRMLKTI